MINEFVRTRQDNSSGKQTGFYDPIKKSKLKTFEDMKKPCTVRRADGKIYKMQIPSELVFQRALALSKDRPDIYSKCACYKCTLCFI